jgi:hypothetical protein
VKRSGAALFLGLERLNEAPRERVEKAGLLTESWSGRATLSG